MTQAAISVPSQAQDAGPPTKVELLALGAGLLAMYLPTYAMLDKVVWSQVGQGHGPVMLALVLWLFWQRWPALRALPLQRVSWAGSLLLAVGLGAYVIGRSQEVMVLDAGSQILILAAMVLFYRGWPGLKLVWFPLFFLLFVVPMPASFVDVLTAPLKRAVSYGAEATMLAAGYDIGREGVILSIGQYKLMVADACAGINSVFALEAIGVFYLSLQSYTRKARNIVLAMLILPISYISNVVRVIALVLITFYFGEEAGLGFIHQFAGVLLFMLATALTVGTDKLLGFLFFREPKA